MRNALFVAFALIASFFMSSCDGYEYEGTDPNLCYIRVQTDFTNYQNGTWGYIFWDESGNETAVSHCVKNPLSPLFTLSKGHNYRLWVTSGQGNEGPGELCDGPTSPPQFLPSFGPVTFSLVGDAEGNPPNCTWTYSESWDERPDAIIENQPDVEFFLEAYDCSCSPPVGS